MRSRRWSHQRADGDSLLPRGRRQRRDGLPAEGALLFLFGCGIGAAVGAGSMVGMLLMRRIFGTAFRGTVRAMATVLGATLGVALLGSLPGSIGTAYFGAKPMPRR